MSKFKVGDTVRVIGTHFEAFDMRAFKGKVGVIAHASIHDRYRITEFSADQVVNDVIRGVPNSENMWIWDANQLEHSELADAVFDLDD